MDRNEKQSLMILVMEDLRGSWAYDTVGRALEVESLAEELGYPQVAQHARQYIENCGWGDDDGRHFRTGFEVGGYMSPPFDVIRNRADASDELIQAVDSICNFPEDALYDD